jgi:pimeloyl-ACP methyl ester carboxylesterase
LILTTLMLPIALLQATKYIDGTWTLAVTRADAAGVALADVLCARHDIGERPVTLVGYSLGARVVFSCLEELARRHARAQKRYRRREKRRARTASVIGVGAHAGGNDPSSDVGSSRTRTTLTTKSIFTAR